MYKAVEIVDKCLKNNREKQKKADSPMGKQGKGKEKTDTEGSGWKLRTCLFHVYELCSDSGDESGQKYYIPSRFSPTFTISPAPMVIRRSPGAICSSR